MNSNGKMFVNFLENNSTLSLLNSSNKCEGTITRHRVKGNEIEDDDYQTDVLLESMPSTSAQALGKKHNG